MLDHINGHKYRVIEQRVEEPPKGYLLYWPIPVVNHSHQIKSTKYSSLLVTGHIGNAILLSYEFIDLIVSGEIFIKYLLYDRLCKKSYGLLLAISALRDRLYYLNLMKERSKAQRV